MKLKFGLLSLLIPFLASCVNGSPIEGESFSNASSSSAASINSNLSKQKYEVCVYQIYPLNGIPGYQLRRFDMCEFFEEGYILESSEILRRLLPTQVGSGTPSPKISDLYLDEELSVLAPKRITIDKDIELFFCIYD